MNKKRLGCFIGLVIVVLLLVVIYWFYFSKPTAFPTNDDVLIEKINAIFPIAKASVIQDAIPVGEGHVFVPFISEKDDYGLSYWVWEKHKWKVGLIDSKGTPMVWQVDRNDPSSYHLVWNIHPEDNLGEVQFYLIRDRGYFITEGIERYYPQVQLEERINFEKSYGTLQLPENWVSVMNGFKDIDSTSQSGIFQHDFFYGQYMRIGWIPVDKNGEEAFPERSVNGTGFSNVDVDLDHVMILNEVDLETWGN